MVEREKDQVDLTEGARPRLAGGAEKILVMRKTNSFNPADHASLGKRKG